MKISMWMIGERLEKYDPPGIDSELIHTLKMGCKSPWRLMVMENPFSSNAIYRRNLLQRLMTLELPCVPLRYEERVLALVSEDPSESILNTARGAGDEGLAAARLSCGKSAGAGVVLQKF